MTSGLRAIRASSWDDVLELPVSNWLWLDMAEGGLHRGELPPAQPAQLSHAWGWTDELLVRLRFDQNLPHGIVGAEINAAKAGAPTEVEVGTTDPARSEWSPTSSTPRRATHAFAWSSSQSQSRPVTAKAASECR